jgi:ribosomal protein S18 acetylase RimI-like enzyme
MGASPLPDGRAGVVVRELTPEDDLDAFGRLVLASYLALPGAPHEPDYDEELRDVATRVRSGVVFGALLGAEPIGCVTFVPDATSPFAEGQRDGESSFRMLAVDGQAQGRGLGEALARRCLDEARAVGSSAVFIYTGTWMPAAQRLYRRLGFVHQPARDWVIDDPPFRLLGFRLEL